MIENTSEPMNYPTLMGVYLAANVIPGAFVIVDGPDCTLYKAHYIHGRHDRQSKLLAVNGHHKIAFTNVCSRGVVKQHDDVIEQYIEMVDAVPESKLVIVTALPMCSITGIDYGRIIRGMEGLTKTAMDIPPDSLIGCWLEGYFQVQVTLAKKLELASDRKRPRTVAVVGYMMDRNEADHTANVAEIKRMIKSLGLEVTSFWLSGEDLTGLKRIEEAEYVISLPYGRAGASKVCEMTGATLIETVLPFGLRKTEQFMREVGKATGRANEAEEFIDMELKKVIPLLQWVVPHTFLHRTTSYIGDPYLLEGYKDIVDDLGMTLEGPAVIKGCPNHTRDTSRSGVSVLMEPPIYSQPVRKIMNNPVDIMLSSYVEKEWPTIPSPRMDFGFPSYRHHALYPNPYLGFQGFLAFIDRMSHHIYGQNSKEVQDVKYAAEHGDDEKEIWRDGKRLYGKDAERARSGKGDDAGEGPGEEEKELATKDDSGEGHFYSEHAHAGEKVPSAKAG